MAVFCSVCAIRIGSAPENEGPFTVDKTFDAGWDLSDADYSGRRRVMIRNTCEECAATLARAVAVAASEIAARHTERIAKLKADMEQWEEQKRRAEQDREDFEAAWNAERARRARGGT